MTNNINEKKAPERRYLSYWKYNAVHILQELEKIVINHGGELVATWSYKSDPPEWLTERKQYLVINRSLSAAIHETGERIEQIKRAGRPVPEKLQNDYERFTDINNDPVLLNYGDYLYINFVYDGFYYSYSMDNNPFFSFYYSKVRIEKDNTIDMKHYSSEDQKEWLYDCFFRFDCSTADQREAANLIFNMLVNAGCSITYRDKNRGFAKLYPLKTYEPGTTEHDEEIPLF